MKKAILFIALFITSCATGTKLKDNAINGDNAQDIKESVVLYESAANGVAEIRLTIKPDYKFLFYMRIIPQPMSNDRESIINASGKWSKQGNWTRLTFRKKKLIISALFDQDYAENSQFKIIDERTVDINDRLDELTIWGVLCIKNKK